MVPQPQKLPVPDHPVFFFFFFHYPMGACLRQVTVIDIFPLLRKNMLRMLL